MITSTLRAVAPLDVGSLLTGLGGWAAIAPGSIPVIVVVMFMVGWLFPKSAMKRAWDEADRWQGAYEKEREARVTAEATAAKAAVVAARAVEVLASIRAGSQVGGDASGTEVAVEDRQGA